jgi:5-methylcytosine-specific restriction endonuclease McrA
MRFSESTKREARWRQNGRCAVCGENLDWQEEFAHHVHPDALDGPDHADNCAILCAPCHVRVHCDGRFRTGIVAPRSYFEYWNG